MSAELKFRKARIPKKPITPDLDPTILELYKTMGIAKIAFKFGLSEQSVILFLKKKEAYRGAKENLNYFRGKQGNGKAEVINED